MYYVFIFDYFQVPKSKFLVSYFVFFFLIIITTEELNKKVINYKEINSRIMVISMRLEVTAEEEVLKLYIKL